MPVVFYQPGLYAVSTTPGGTTDPGSVSYRVEGHWRLTPAAVGSLQSQATSYLEATTFSGNTNLQFSGCNQYQGVWSVATGDLTTQAGSVNAILSNPANYFGVA